MSNNIGLTVRKDEAVKVIDSIPGEVETVGIRVGNKLVGHIDAEVLKAWSKIHKKQKRAGKQATGRPAVYDTPRHQRQREAQRRYRERLKRKAMGAE